MPKTILLTGVTGFIAKRIAVDLLNAGYAVRGSLRSTSRQQEVNAAIAPHLLDPTHLTRLSFQPLDLTKDSGWADAMSGVDAVIHTASPFPLAEPKNEDELIRPAVDGALRALKAAQKAGVKRVVLTSSTVAIMQKDFPDGYTLSPADWSEIGHPSMGSYAKSKTMAEKAAWDFVTTHPEMQLTTINPGLVLGAPTDSHYGSSLDLVRQLMTGKLPFVPNFGFPIVDIRDVSAAHVAALSKPESIGKRFLLAESYMMMPEMVRILKASHPEARLPRGKIPKVVVRLGALVSKQARGILPMVGKHAKIDNSATTEILGVTFTPAAEAITRAADAVSSQTKS